MKDAREQLLEEIERQVTENRATMQARLADYAANPLPPRPPADELAERLVAAEHLAARRLNMLERMGRWNRIMQESLDALPQRNLLEQIEFLKDDARRLLRRAEEAESTLSAVRELL